MSLSRISLVSIAVALWIAPSSAQPRLSRCLHGETETPMQAQRREEALDGADLINRMLERHRPGAAYPTWEALAKAPAVTSLRGLAGVRGDLARKMEWGADEPLPGWRIHYVSASHGYAFSLTDSRDPCQLTLTSNDSGIVFEGRPVDRRSRVRVIPLDSSQ
jgi:hypothetical protein